MLGLLDRLVVEHLRPSLEAFALEVERDPHVDLVGRELVGDLLDEKLERLLADHGVSLARPWRLTWRVKPS
jgi:hypothetical protein